MIILHCMKEAWWKSAQKDGVFGKEDIMFEGFVHCSTLEYFWRVAPNFADIEDPLVLALIDTEKLTVPIKFEDGDNCGRLYPHVYGEISVNAVTAVYPLVMDGERWIKGEHFAGIEDL